MEKRELEWGQTPWDNMSKEELLFTVCRMYKAVKSLYGCLGMSRLRDERSPYWGTEGSGGRALEMGRQVVEPIESNHDGEDVYRSFFRYATDLLFDCSEYDLGFGWAVCPECGVMLGRSGDADSQIGKKCKDAFGLEECAGVFRALQWEDLDRQDFARLDLAKEI